MSSSSNDSVSQVEAQLESAERVLSSVSALNEREAARVGERMDRLASQLLTLSVPTPIGAVHGRLGTIPASADDFAEAAREMAPPDSEG